MNERVKFINFYAALQEVEFLAADTKSNKSLCKWAYNVVYTRYFNEVGQTRYDGGEKKIVPMADMLNHGTFTEVDIQYDDDGNCYAYTTKDVPAGSPLRLSYGDPTNPSYLFASYGFVDETSPATFCKLMNIRPTPELKDIGLDFSRMLFFKETGDGKLLNK